MGFGIALIGYLCMMLVGTGGEIFAALLLGYGFFLASRLNPNFLRASVSVLFMLPRGIVNALSVIGLFDINNLNLLNVITFLLFLTAWLFMSYFWLIAVAQIAKENGVTKLENQARFRLVFTVSFIMLVMGSRILAFSGALTGATAMLGAVEFLLQYAVIFINILFLHTCFILITSEKQYEKDRQQIAKDRAKALEKKQREADELNEIRKK